MKRYVFQFTISRGGIDDSLMFSYPPTMKDIINGLKAHQAIADKDYHDWYEECIKEIPTLRAWTDTRPRILGMLVSTRGPLGKHPDYDGSYDFKRHTVIEN